LFDYWFIDWEKKKNQSLKVFIPFFILGGKIKIKNNNSHLKKLRQKSKKKRSIKYFWSEVKKMKKYQNKKWKIE